MITPNDTLTAKIKATLNLRTQQVLEAQTEIAKLQQRIIALQTENQLLSYRLVQAEQERPNG